MERNEIKWNELSGTSGVNLMNEVEWLNQLIGMGYSRGYVSSFHFIWVNLFKAITEIQF